MKTLFEQMKRSASAILQNAEKDQYTQAIVLLSASGNEYSTIINNALSEDKNQETAFLEEIKSKQDTEIRYILCMWQDNGCIDIPSFAFRKMLCSLDERNSDSLLFVMTADNKVSERRLASTLK